jgi:hypothetical protein
MWIFPVKQKNGRFPDQIDDFHNILRISGFRRQLRANWPANFMVCGPTGTENAQILRQQRSGFGGPRINLAEEKPRR